MLKTAIQTLKQLQVNKLYMRVSRHSRKKAGFTAWEMFISFSMVGFEMYYGLWSKGGFCQVALSFVYGLKYPEAAATSNLAPLTFDNLCDSIPSTFARYI